MSKKQQSSDALASNDAQASNDAEETLLDTKQRLGSLSFSGEVAGYRETFTEEEKNEKVQKKNAENRYGKNIRMEKFKMSNSMLNFTLICSIFMIPLQLFF